MKRRRVADEGAVAHDQGQRVLRSAHHAARRRHKAGVQPAALPGARRISIHAQRGSSRLGLRQGQRRCRFLSTIATTNHDVNNSNSTPSAEEDEPDATATLSYLRNRYEREGATLAQFGQEATCAGSMLYMSNLKVRVATLASAPRFRCRLTREYRARADAPHPRMRHHARLLARAGSRCRRGAGHYTLDLFLGLGYASLAALELGAARVFACEKYAAVTRLVERNPWSAGLVAARGEGRFALEAPLDVQANRSAALLRRFEQWRQAGQLPSLFNSVVLDPPKKKVMLSVYSPPFVERLSGAHRSSISSLQPRAHANFGGRRLAEWVEKDGLVAAYMPPGGLSPLFTQCREELVQTFEGTHKFAFVDCWDEQSMIWRFRRR